METNKPEVTITEGLKDQLAKRYCGDEWALFFEVPDGTGSAKLRTADALVMNLWPSRGLELIGFEVKSSRGDWRNELKNPEKAESICRFCNRWYIVAPKDIVKVDELPPTWGLLESTGKQLRIKVKAPALKPVDVDRAFLAGILRRASAKGTEDRAEIRDAGYQEGLENGGKFAKSDLERINQERDELQKIINDFSRASGIIMSKWDDNVKVGQAVRLMLSSTNNQIATIDRLVGGYRKTIEKLLEVQNELEVLK